MNSPISRSGEHTVTRGRDEAMESPTSPASRVDFYDFLDRMRRPAAAGLFRSIKRSVRRPLQVKPTFLPTHAVAPVASPPDGSYLV